MLIRSLLSIPHPLFFIQLFPKPLSRSLPLSPLLFFGTRWGKGVQDRFSVFIPADLTKKPPRAASVPYPLPPCVWLWAHIVILCRCSRSRLRPFYLSSPAWLILSMFHGLLLLCLPFLCRLYKMRMCAPAFRAPSRILLRPNTPPLSSLHINYSSYKLLYYLPEIKSYTVNELSLFTL